MSCWLVICKIMMKVSFSTTNLYVAMLFHLLFCGHQCQSFPPGNKKWAMLQVWQLITTANFPQDESLYSHHCPHSNCNENLHEYHGSTRLLVAVGLWSVENYFELIFTVLKECCLCGIWDVFKFCGWKYATFHATCSFLNKREWGKCFCWHN